MSEVIKQDDLLSIQLPELHNRCADSEQQMLDFSWGQKSAQLSVYQPDGKTELYHFGFLYYDDKTHAGFALGGSAGYVPSEQGTYVLMNLEELGADEQEIAPDIAKAVLEGLAGLYTHPHPEIADQGAAIAALLEAYLGEAATL